MWVDWDWDWDWDWDGSPGGCRYRAPYGANKNINKQTNKRMQGGAGRLYQPERPKGTKDEVKRLALTHFEYIRGSQCYYFLRRAHFCKKTGVRQAKRRAKFKLCIKKARKFDSRHFNNKSA